MELIALLRQLADELEKGQRPKFDIDDPGTREALETLFNTWYERAYKDVEEKLESLDDSVRKLDDKFDELPGDLDGHEGRIEDVESTVDELKEKIKDLADIDGDAVEEAVDLARKMDDVDVKALARLDFGELEEMMSFFRTLKAHFAPSMEREAA